MAVEIKVPALGESVNEATVAKWFKAVGDSVAMDEPIVELETDKVTLEVPAGAAGTLSEMRVAAGETVTVGTVLGIIGGAGAPRAAVAAAAAPAAPPPPPAPAAKPAATPTSGPAARKMMAEAKLEPSAVAGTGKDGRVTKGDVMARADQAPAPAARPAPPPVAETRQVPRTPGEREERVRMTRLRKRIAERLKHAQNTAAILTTFNECDMTQVMALRERFRDSFEKKHKVRLGFLPFFVKACIAALKEIPAVNGEIDGDDIVYKNRYDIGVAVSAPQGLVVPVVRDADRMNFAELERTIAELGTRARDGKLAIEDLTGGTFTISNGGVFGSLLSTPILNPPQSGILGMHKIQPRPVAVGDKVEVRPMMYTALSYDHRIVDGREAVTFLVRVKECIEDPQRLLLGL